MQMKSDNPNLKETLHLSSKAFENGREIPEKYTCEGADISPPLRWIGVPTDAKSLVLTITDPDAPDPAAPKRTWVHWIVINLSPENGELIEGASSSKLPPEAQEGLNDWERVGYGGPCPPIGRHRYVHTLYALDTKLTDLRKITKQRLEQEMEGHVIARTELVGTYQKKKT